MEVQSSTTRLAGDKGTPMDLYVVAPTGEGKRPALLVIMEVFGVNSHIKELTQRFAKEGYVAAAPDLYYRLEKKVSSYDNLQEAFAMRETLYEPKIVADINRAILYLKSRPEVDADRLGVIGYCFGGRVAWLAACECSGLSAAAVYYGGSIVGGQRGEKSPVEPVTLADKIKIPMLCVWGEEDQTIPADVRDKIAAALKANNVEHEWFVYAGAGHGFFCDDRRRTYQEPSAKDVWQKTLAFFARCLKKPAAC